MHCVGRMRDFLALNLTVYVVTTKLCRANYELVSEMKGLANLVTTYVKFMQVLKVNVKLSLRKPWRYGGVEVELH